MPSRKRTYRSNPALSFEQTYANLSNLPNAPVGMRKLNYDKIKKFYTSLKEYLFLEQIEADVRFTFNVAKKFDGKGINITSLGNMLTIELPNEDDQWTAEDLITAVAQPLADIYDAEDMDFEDDFADLQLDLFSYGN